MDMALIKTEPREITEVLGRIGDYATEVAGDGMSVELLWFPREQHLSQRLNMAYSLISRLRKAGYWVSDKTYWSAHAADLLAEGKPVWVGRVAASNPDRHETKPLSVRLTAGDRARLEAAAAHAGISVHAAIKTGVAMFTEKTEGEMTGGKVTSREE